MCLPDIVKNMNIKALNLMSRTNETRHIKFHETYKCKCRFDTSVCNNKQCCNKDECMCECKELIDEGRCVKDLLGTLAIVNVNVINYLMLENIKTMTIANE